DAPWTAWCGGVIGA
ncbi:hypothetical protein MKD33_16570, partial [Chromobacterium piscinae]